jgi:hypothetical protein
LLIVGRAEGHLQPSELTIFALIVFAAISHSSGKACLAFLHVKQP